MAHLADADQHRRHMRQRRQVTRGSDRTLRRNARIDPRLIELVQRLDHFPAHPGKAARQRCHLQRQDQADGGIVQQRAGAGAVGQQQVALQGGELVAGNGSPRQQAEAGVDAIHRALAGDDLAHRLLAGFNHCTTGRVELDIGGLLVDRAELVEGQLAGGDKHHG
ncbi:hypothetical protein D3C81_1712280 [compost metagenome]